MAHLPYDYLRAARKHVAEVYGLLLQSDAEVKASIPKRRPKLTDAELYRQLQESAANFEHRVEPSKTRAALAAEEREARAQLSARVLQVVAALEGCARGELRKQFLQWNRPATEMLGLTEAERRKIRLEDEPDRSLFLASVLWYGNAACMSLIDNYPEKLFWFGSSLRDVTKAAAGLAAERLGLGRRTGRLPCLPEDARIVKALSTKDLERYELWTFPFDARYFD